LVNFCQKCGFLLIPKIQKNFKSGFISLYCNSCKTLEEIPTESASYHIKTRIPHKENDRTLIIDEEFYIDPTVRTACPKCGHNEAHYWESSNRKKLEWEPITYYRCLKCKYTWND
jgi:DNA-directed RNA polymerase subunit M